MPTALETLSSEERISFENVLSLLQQILGSQKAAGAEEVEKNDDKDEDDMYGDKDKDKGTDVAKKSKTVKKDEMNSDGDAETGDDKAEDRLDSDTPVTEESMKELTKSLTAMLTKSLTGGSKPVVKAKTSESSTVLKALDALGTTLEKIVTKMDEQDQFNSIVMNQLGVTEEIVQKALPAQVQDTKKGRPVQDNQLVIKDVVASVVSEVMKSLGHSVATPDPAKPKSLLRTNNRDDGDEVNKDMTTIRSLFRKNHETELQNLGL